MKNKKALIIIASISIVIVVCLMLFLLKRNSISNVNDIGNISADYREYDMEQEKNFIEENEVAYDYNTFKKASISDVSMIKKYIYKFYEYCYADPEKAYDLIDKTYAQVNFPNYEVFKNYVKNNMEEIYKLTDISSYNTTKYSDKYVYIAQTKTGKTYSIIEDYPMEFKISFDSLIIRESIIGKEKEESNVKVVLTNKNVYYDKMEYELNIQNLTSSTININIKDIKLLVANSSNIVSSMDNIDDGNIIVTAGNDQKVKVTYKKNFFNNTGIIKGIVLNKINIGQATISIEVQL